MDAGPLTFRRQFILGPRPAGSPAVAGWQNQDLGGGLHLSAHPELPVTCAASGAVRLAVLGEILDPRQPALSNRDLATLLTSGLGSPADFEARILALGGRWVAILSIGGCRYVYHDAGGTRTAYTVPDPGGDGHWVASQPMLLAETITLRRDDALLERARRTCHDGWSAAVTPYAGCRQLLPNHVLDLQTGSSRRFWPTGLLPRTDIASAAAEIGDLLYGSIAAAARRRPLSLAVTGGYDSRTLLACSRKLRPRMRFHTLAFDGGPRYDRDVPMQLAARLGLDWQLHRGSRSSPAMVDIVQRNGGQLHWSSFSRDLQSWQIVPDGHFEIVGTLSEVLRSYFPRPVRETGRPSAGSLEALLGTAGDVTHHAYRDWLAELPDSATAVALDLFYLENAMGTYGALAHTCADTVVDRLLPFANRRIFELGLGLDPARRRPPYPLHRRIIANAEPRCLDIPFNDSGMLDRATFYLKGKLRRLRRKAARTLATIPRMAN